VMAAAAATSNNNTVTMQEFMIMFNNKFENLEKTMNAKLELICKPVGEKPEKPKRPPRIITNETYCWTHGYRVSATHNSKTCTRRAVGHQEEATRDNNMGGSQVGKPNQVWQVGASEKTVINKINNNIIGNLTRTPPKQTHTPAIFDSGTTGHYILCDTACFDKRPTSQPLTVTLPNGEKIKSTHEATLPFPNLPKKALEAHVFPGLNGQALLSIGTFCDAGCTALFTTMAVIIARDGKVVLTGQRQPPGLRPLCIMTNVCYKVVGPVIDSSCSTSFSVELSLQ
jgi:hypothetical protein